MLLRILLEDEEYRPYFPCSRCMDVITKDQPGVMCWPVNMQHPQEVEHGLIVHKGKCLESIKSIWDSQGYRFMWTELNNEAMTQLKNNTQATKHQGS